MDIRAGDILTLHAPRIPRLDGAVAELAQHPDGTITVEIRIPGPAAK